ncbi:MAG: FAD-binding oxidoreductase [Acidimicrobiales bacterium]|nr:FAD-binding oxidoreductase [Acidimicrobiales bacterium]
MPTWRARWPRTGRPSGPSAAPAGSPSPPSTPRSAPDVAGDELGPGRPVPPIALDRPAAQVGTRLRAQRVEVPDRVVEHLRAACGRVALDDPALVEASRDWWPIAIAWALDGDVAARAAVVARPGDADEVAAVLQICNEARIPVTAAAGRSGVCGASVPVHGGVVLDLTGLRGIVEVDDLSLVAEVRAGTFGDHFEDELGREHGLTCGHWPQSMALSTVGGWLACRGAGQLSTRYGKIEDMVVGLDVVLADGRRIRTGGAPRAATGPDLTQLFVGSEGTLGVITAARLRLHPAPTAEGRSAWGFGSFDAGLEVCRRILRRGATPAVLRLYDAVEADRSYQTGDRSVLLVLDEGDGRLVDASLDVVADECRATGAEPLDEGLVGRWLEHRNDVSALEALYSRGYVVDTMEVTAPWGVITGVYHDTVAALRTVPHCMVASAHQSHSYTDGACLYFTLAGKPPADEKDAFYRAAWDAGTQAVLAAGGNLSHHHGVGLNRARFMVDALGPALDVLAGVKQALDPTGILNPGKLGLPDPWGPVGWP